jgi:hypothetical protein
MRACFLSILLMLAGCASDVPRLPSALAPIPTGAQSTKNTFTLNQSVTLVSSTGYSSVMRAGSRWLQVGRIAEGDVYRTDNSIFQVEGKHIHEAFAVIESGKIVGFYLPVEKAYSPLPNPVSLPTP